MKTDAQLKDDVIEEMFKRQAEADAVRRRRPRRPVSPAWRAIW